MAKKDDYKDIFLDFIKNKKVQIAFTVLLFLIILISSTQIRLSNMPSLVDETSGEYIPLALDPFYFLRIAETIVEEGFLPDYDNLRHPSDTFKFSSEKMPYVVVGIYKLVSLFRSEISIQYIDVISPVIFYSLGLIIFFFLVYVLTKSKTTSLLASALLAYSPSYLYRTMAGFSDHEAIGMLATFLCLLVYLISLKKFDKSNKKTIIYSILTGFFTSVVLASWGGALSFLLLILPTSFLLYWFVHLKERKKELLFYSLWFISWFLFSLLFGFSIDHLIGRLTSSNGLLVLFVFVYILVNYFVEKYAKKAKFLQNKNEKTISILITLVLGLLSLITLGKNPFELLKNIWSMLVSPFGTQRVSLTVAENAQPYLLDWISQSGNILFYIFLAGTIFIGLEFSKNVKAKQWKILFSASWSYMILALLYSRVSASHLFNGTNFISQVFYVSGLLFFGFVFIKLYIDSGFKEDSKLLIFFPIVLFVLITGRSAVRSFFLITPFVVLIAANFVTKIYHYAKESKAELGKLLLWILFISSLVGSLWVIYEYESNISLQATYITPSANTQWQKAMEWVRTNTPETAVFSHWWDYGYWVQGLGERATISDGGRFQGSYRDHLFGRYVLTEQNPERALSFFKSNDVDYLLIDPTDFGKYGAFSKIGSDNSWDRFSPSGGFAGTLDTSQTLETSEGMTRVYPINGIVDEDLYYTKEGTEIFLPGPSYDSLGNPSYKSYIIAVLIKTSGSGNNVNILQPEVAFVTQNKQYTIPLRYVYINGEILDFDSGLEGVISIVPTLSQGVSGDVQISNLGSVIYLSPKVSESLFAQVYLLDNVFGNYNSLELVHSEPDSIVASLLSQGANIPETIYYQGLRSPIKIWKINSPENILVNEEFKSFEGEYARFDDLEFTK